MKTTESLGMEKSPITLHLKILIDSNLFTYIFTFHWCCCSKCIGYNNGILGHFVTIESIGRFGGGRFMVLYFENKDIKIQNVCPIICPITQNEYSGYSTIAQRIVP